MKKSDLKTGMQVTQRNGVRAIVMLGTSRGDIVVSQASENERTWYPLSSVSDRLRHGGSINREDSEYDIMSVQDFVDMNSGCFKSYQSIWKREEARMTLDQVCEELGRDIKIIK